MQLVRTTVLFACFTFIFVLSGLLLPRNDGKIIGYIVAVLKFRLGYFLRPLQTISIISVCQAKMCNTSIMYCELL